MLFDDKTLENIVSDMGDTVDSGINIAEGTLIDHSFRGAAAEFEKVYMELGLIDQNGYAETADREHLILRAIIVTHIPDISKAGLINCITMPARISPRAIKRSSFFSLSIFSLYLTHKTAARQI